MTNSIMKSGLKVLKKTIFNCVHYFLSLVAWLSSPAFSFIFEPKFYKRLPPLNNELLLKPATEIASEIRKRKVTAEMVMESFIVRIKQVNGDLNALIADRFSAALEEARKVDNALDSGKLPAAWTADKAPFLGVPFTAKEAFAITGLPNTSGLLSRRGALAEKDADVIRLLKDAGAIFIGLTNCSELCMWYESSNLLYGRTNNAYHQGRIVGGSSGGEGCILSAAGSVVGVGSDIGGSIRMPSFFNGVFGHKPSRGIVSSLGQFPCAVKEALDFLSTGPMCRYATDLGPLLKVMAGSADSKKLQLDSKVDVRRLKVFYMEDDGGSFMVSPVHPEIKAAIRKAAKHMESLGCVVQKVSLAELKLSFDIWSCMMQTSENQTFCSLMGGGPEVKPWLELLLWVIGRPRHTLPAIGLGIAEKIPFPKKTVAFLRGKCEDLKAQFEDLLGDNGVFFYPTHPLPAPYHNQPLTLIPNFSYTGIFNVLGLPATNVPMGLASREKVPVGFQVVGAHERDRNCLAVAVELEAAFGGWVPPGTT